MVWRSPPTRAVLGDLVYQSGHDGTNPEVTAATNTDLDTRATYVVLETIAASGSGAIGGIATIGSLNTNAYTVGDKLYLDTAGGYTDTAPTGATDVVQEVGVVKVKSATVGEILFYPGLAKLQGIEASDIMGLTATAAELNVLDGVTAGTVTASLGVVVDASKDIGEFNQIRTAELNRDSANLQIDPTTSGNIEIDAVDDLDVDAVNCTMDFTGTASIDAVGNSNLTVDTGDLTLNTTTSGDMIADSAGLLDVDAAGVIQLTSADSSAAAIYLECSDAAGGIDMDCGTTGFAVDSTGALSLDGVGNSNLTADTGDLTLSTTTSGDVKLDSAANVILEAASGSDILCNDDADPTRQMALDMSGLTAPSVRLLSMADEDVALASCIPRLLALQITTTELTASANSQSINFATAIPAKAIVHGAWFDLDTVFSGGGAASCVIDVGDGTDADGYVDNEDVFTGATTGQRSTPTTAPALLDSNGVDIDDGARTPAVLITADVNVDTLTAGDVTAYILYTPSPLGATIS